MMDLSLQQIAFALIFVVFVAVVAYAARVARAKQLRELEKRRPGVDEGKHVEL